MHSYTFNTKHVSSETVKHAASHEMHVLVAHLLQPSAVDSHDNFRNHLPEGSTGRAPSTEL